MSRLCWASFACLLCAILATPTTARDDTDPEPPGGKLKVLDEPDHKPTPPDVIFVPTPQKVVEQMLELAKPAKKDVVSSLGCGDGRFMVTAAKTYGCRAVGFDIDPSRVKDSKSNIESYKLERLAFVRQRDIFKLDLSEATVVTLYLLPDLNVKLIPQLKKLKKGSRIVSHNFDMRGVTPDKVVKVEDGGKTSHVYLWTTPLKFDKR